MKNDKPNKMLWLVVGIPLTSVIVGIVTMFLAFGVDDSAVQIEEKPLSKTSWRDSP